MTTTSWTLTLAAHELELIADGLEGLAVRGRLAEVASFALNHPEFGLLTEAEEPADEELQ